LSLAATLLVAGATVAARQPTRPVVPAVQPTSRVVAAVQPHTPMVAAEQDAEYRAALDLLYDGRPAECGARLAALEAAHPEDAVPAYLQALALEWTLEQRPESTDLDRVVEQAATRAWAAADARLRRDAADVRARFARGAASGVRSRYHLFRLHRAQAARTAAEMREDLLAARAQDPRDADVLFGLGLYDYYADVLPRFARVLRFLAGLPSGNRARGLLAIEGARRSSVLHGVEAQAQLYEIHAFYEDDPERAAEEMADLFRRYPGWPLWGLKLAEHLRDRLGDYAGSEAVSRALLKRADDAQGTPGPGAMALARLSLGRTLLLDLRPDEARRVLLPIEDGLPGERALGAQARMLLGRSLELEGDREGAAAHYRVAAASADQEWRRRAQTALSRPLSAEEVAGRRRLGALRRARRAGRADEVAARAREVLAAWPASREAALAAAGEDLRAGRPGRLRVPEVEEARGDEPPWLVPWSRLLRAQAADLAGDREAAVVLYKKVYASARRRAELRQAAATGLRAPFRPETPRAAPSVPARTRGSTLPTAPGAGFLAVRPFSTATSTG
jgi:hypothetical protein